MPWLGLIVLLVRVILLEFRVYTINACYHCRLFITNSELPALPNPHKLHHPQYIITCDDTSACTAYLRSFYIYDQRYGVKARRAHQFLTANTLDDKRTLMTQGPFAGPIARDQQRSAPRTHLIIARCTTHTCIRPHTSCAQYSVSTIQRNITFMRFPPTLPSTTLSVK